MTKIKKLSSLADQRLYVVDILKLSFIIALVVFHIWEYCKYENQMATPTSESFYSYYYHILTLGLFRFTGLLLTALSFFLFGFRNSTLSLKKVFIFFAGIILVQIEVNGRWSWDVYSFLLVTYLICQVIAKRPRVLVGVLGLCLLALSQSAKVWSELLGPHLNFARDVFVASELSEGPNGWFLFPWLFLPIATYCIGALSKIYEEHLIKISRGEIGFWVVFLLGCAYFGTNSTSPQAGRDFYRYLFWGEAREFWPNFILLLALIRLNFVETVRRFFSPSRFYFLSKIQWLQSLWLCYFVHFIFIFYFAERYAEGSTIPHYLDFAWLGTLLLTECCVQILFYFKGLIQRHHTSSGARV